MTEVGGGRRCLARCSLPATKCSWAPCPSITEQTQSYLYLGYISYELKHTYLDLNDSSIFQLEASQFVQQLVCSITALDVHGCVEEGPSYCTVDSLIECCMDVSSPVSLTTTIALHATCSVDCVTEQTVARHLHSHNACTHRARVDPCSYLQFGVWAVRDGEGLTTTHELESHLGYLPRMVVSIGSWYSRYYHVCENRERERDTAVIYIMCGPHMTI